MHTWMRQLLTRLRHTRTSCPGSRRTQRCRSRHADQHHPCLPHTTTDPQSRCRRPQCPRRAHLHLHFPFCYGIRMLRNCISQSDRFLLRCVTRSGDLTRSGELSGDDRLLSPTAVRSRGRKKCWGVGVRVRQGHANF